MAKYPLATVGALIIAQDGEILLVKSKKWCDLYSIPGGKIEYGEEMEAALSREIREETNLKVKNIRYAMNQECIFSKEFWEPRHFIMHDFIAELDDETSKDHVRLNDEAYDYLWIIPRESLKLPLHAECRALIEWYLRKGNPSRLPAFTHVGIYKHQVDCIVGLYPEEREHEQSLFIDLKIQIDPTSFFLSGKIQDTIDYVRLARMCTELANRNQYDLLESYASDILEQCRTKFDASGASVRIEKPAAISTAACAFVEMEYQRED